jgi:hypothetical protein
MQKVPLYDKKHTLQVFIHIIIWLIVTAFPIIFIYSEGERELLRYIDFTFPIVLMIVVFYTNYFYIIGKYLFNKKIWQFFVINLVLIALSLFLLEVMQQYVWEHYLSLKRPPRPGGPSRESIMMMMFVRNALTVIFTVGLATAIKMTILWYNTMAEQKEKEKLHIESELTNLKHQLNPHFLFNTLNNIYSLISINQENAQDAVHRLSNLIRYVLYESDQPFVPLAKDLNFTSNYIQLMSLRLPPHVKLQTDIMKPRDNQLIAPLLFISLVENAFKHGVSPTSSSHISVRIGMEGKDELVCRVENSNFPKHESDQSGSGIGLSNLRKRLELIYPKAFSMDIEENAENYITTLTLKL